MHPDQKTLKSHLSAFLSDCDTSFISQSIDVYFEPTLITLDEEVTCRSTQAFPFATASVQVAPKRPNTERGRRQSPLVQSVLSVGRSH